MRVDLSEQLAAGLLLGVPSIAVLGCSGDAVTAPTTGSVEITTATSGPEPDADGYTLSFDGARLRPRIQVISHPSAGETWNLFR